MKMVEANFTNIHKKKANMYVYIFSIRYIGYPTYKSVFSIVLVICFSNGCSHTPNFLKFRQSMILSFESADPQLSPRKEGLFVLYYFLPNNILAYNICIRQLPLKPPASERK